MGLSDDRCEYSDLPAETCAHCTGTSEPRYSHQALAGLAGSPDLRKGRQVGRELDTNRLFAPAEVDTLSAIVKAVTPETRFGPLATFLRQVVDGDGATWIEIFTEDEVPA